MLRQLPSGSPCKLWPIRPTSVPERPVRVGEQEGGAGLALEQRGQVGLAVLALKDQQIGLPVAEGPAILDLGRPLLDGAVGRHERGARLAAVAWLPPAACLGQVPVESLLAALGT